MLDQLDPVPQKQLSLVYIANSSLPQSLRERSLTLVERIIDLENNPQAGLILPWELFSQGMFPWYNQNRQIKKEDTLKIRRHQNLTPHDKQVLIERIQQRKDPLEELMKIALKQVRPEQRLIAFDLQGDFVNEEIYRIIPFFDIVRSQLALAELKGKKARISGRVNFLADTDKIYDHGALVEVTVPSFEEDNKEYKFYLRGLCMKKAHHGYTRDRAERVLRTAYNVEPDLCCERTRNFKHYGRYVDRILLPKGTSVDVQEQKPEVIDRKGKDILIDHHVLLALRMVKDAAYQNGLIMVATPALFVDKATLGFTEAMSRVYQEVAVWRQKKGSGRWVRDYAQVPLSKTMKNYWIAKLAGYRNHNGWSRSL